MSVFHIYTTSTVLLAQSYDSRNINLSLTTFKWRPVLLSKCVQINQLRESSDWLVSRGLFSPDDEVLNVQLQGKIKRPLQILIQSAFLEVLSPVSVEVQQNKPQERHEVIKQQCERHENCHKNRGYLKIF